MEAQATEAGLYKSWSNTQFDKFMSCPRKYYYTYVLDKKALDPAGVAAQYSAMVIHPMLADMYTGAGVATVVAKLEGHYKRFEQCHGLEASLSPQFSEEAALRVMEKYSSVVDNDREYYEVVATEEPFYVTLADAVVTVKPDVVLASKEDGRVMPLDFKVSSREKPSNRLQHHTQFVGQAIATGSDSVWVDSITIDKKGKVSMARDEVFVSEELKEEWRSEMYLAILQRNLALASGVWVKRSDSCYSYGQPCPFIVACSQGRVFGEGLL